jgi:hypothetical protein
MKTASYYAACSIELGVVCYGACWEEAINNLAELLHTTDTTRGGSGGTPVSPLRCKQ